MAAFSNSSSRDARFICLSRSFTIRRSSSFGMSLSPYRIPASSAMVGSGRRMRSVMSLISLVIDCGVMPCFLLCLLCRERRRFVSLMACFMESVMLSAYMTTCPSMCRAALPIVWMSDVPDLRNPSLSASSIATSDTSGRSIPSRSRFIPTTTSYVPMRRSRSISVRSRVSISECR